MNIRGSKLIYIPLLLALLSLPALSQSLNWEGQTGAFITPFAYTSGSEANKVGKPAIAFHYLNAGAVVGDSVQASITVGMFKRTEFGYTRTIKMDGDSSALSPLFKGGFNTFHGKLNLVSENVNKTKWVPAISVGFVARTHVKRVGGVIGNKTENSGDIYIVATKTITQIHGLPILLSGGYKATNSSVFGVAGNAPDWTGRAFGAAAFVVKGPSKSTLIFGSEFAQQPRRIKGLAGATVPTSLTYFVRILPAEKLPFNIDFGVAQVAGKIMPGVDLKARHQFAMGMSYKF